MFAVIDASTTRMSENLKWRLVPQNVEINVWNNVWKSTLPHKLHVRGTQKIQPSYKPNWRRYALWRYEFTRFLLDQTSFEMVQQTGCRYVNFGNVIRKLYRVCIASQRLTKRTFPPLSDHCTSFKALLCRKVNLSKCIYHIQASQTVGPYTWSRTVWLCGTTTTGNGRTSTVTSNASSSVKCRRLKLQCLCP